MLNPEASPVIFSQNNKKELFRSSRSISAHSAVKTHVVPPSAVKRHDSGYFQVCGHGAKTCPISF